MDSIERVLRGAELHTLGWSPVSHRTLTPLLRWGEALLLKSDCLHFSAEEEYWVRERRLPSHLLTLTHRRWVPLASSTAGWWGWLVWVQGPLPRRPACPHSGPVATPLCPWPVRFCLRGWQPWRQPGNCTHLTQHIISSLWNVTLCEGQCCLMLDTWTWRETFSSAALLFFPWSPHPSCATLGVSLEWKDPWLRWGLLQWTGPPSAPWGPFRLACLYSSPFQISLLSWRQSPKRLLHFHYHLLWVLFSLLGSNSSILCKLPGSFCNLLFHSWITKVGRMSFQSPYLSCVFLLLLHLPEAIAPSYRCGSWVHLLLRCDDWRKAWL